MSQKLKDLHAARKAIYKDLSAAQKANRKAAIKYAAEYKKDSTSPEVEKAYKESFALVDSETLLCHKLSAISDKIDNEIVRIVLKLSAGK